MDSDQELVKRCVRLLEADDISHSIKARVEFLRSKQIREGIIREAISLYNSGKTPQNQYHYEALDGDIDWGVRAGLVSVGVALGCVLVKGVRWFNGDDSSMWGEADENEQHDGDDAEGVGNAIVQREEEVVGEIIEEEDEDDEGGGEDGGSAQANLEEPPPPVVTSSHIPEPTVEERQERREITNEAFGFLRKKEEEKEEKEEKIELKEKEGGECVDEDKKEKNIQNPPAIVNTAIDDQPAAEEGPNLPALRTLLSTQKFTAPKLKLLYMYLSNLTANPSTKMYHTVQTTNSQFRRNLGEGEGEEVLCGWCGFEKEGRKLVWKGGDIAGIEGAKLIIGDAMKQVESTSSSS
ncbi:hypothetical protein TrVE_jg3743 [Triparma verrucosa]|uniref:PUB domain-containing protein n=1 Tax=Triparma verrucosa TaxID=1606542 RepID=A0A9W7B388_9STRA|nr:hypothetical protein TrVE_jg3743 [Triparma verrucosa]